MGSKCRIGNESVELVTASVEQSVELVTASMYW